MILQVDKDGEDFIKGLADLALKAGGLQNLQFINMALASLQRIDLKQEPPVLEAKQEEK